MIALTIRCLLASIAFGLTARAAPPPIPVESFFRESEMHQPSLSKDGTRVVFLVRNAPARNSIATYDVRTKKGAIVFVPNDYNVDFAFWKGDRIVFGGDAGGNESYALRSIKADGSSLRDLSESVDRFRHRHATGPVGGNVYSMLPDDPEHILIAGLGTSRNISGEMHWAGGFGLYRLNVGSGRRTPVEGWDDHATSYIVDGRSGHVYGRTLEEGRDQIVEIKNLTGEYCRVARFTGSTMPWHFRGLLPGEKDALLEIRSVDEHDRGALFAFSRESLKAGKPLYVPAEGEIAFVKRGQDGGILAIAREAEKTVTDWFDPTWARCYASLQATFPGQRVDLVSSTDDARMHIAYVSSDRDPGAYYLYDAATPLITPIGKVNPKIDPARMASREPIQFTARDGLQIHGYLTRPPGRPGQKHPLIVLPHGGPFGIRDSWGFDPEAQFLASRGYAVLQVNYRGSGGYGARFEQAGKRQWGRAMQDDLSDAVHWAVEQKFTAADEVGIYGASYGGYATLAGLTFTPALYRCGANYVGVSDLRLLAHPLHPISAADGVWLEESIGNDAAELRARSPVEFVENIRVPSLHAYGENDPRVDINHWKVLERELKQHNKPYTFIREGDEGHGFEDEKSRIRFYTALEEFFAKNLPASGQVELGETKTIELPANERR